MSAGWVLFCVTLSHPGRQRLLRVWGISAIVAALYGILDYHGFGARALFRETDFSFGPVMRLSGSFEYPNTAAAFFGLSLPIVWTSLQRRWLRIAGMVIVWAAMILTYSRGAVVAALAVMLIWGLRQRTRVLLPTLIGAGVSAGLLAYQPSLLQRFGAAGSFDEESAEYRPEYNRIGRPPDRSAELAVRVKNSGTKTWSSEMQLTVTPRWYDIEVLKLVRTPPVFVPVPASVRPLETVDLRVPIHTPAEPGVYLLTFDLSRSGEGWFSARGVVPGLVEVHVQPGESWSGNGDLGRWRERKFTDLIVVQPFSRRELWTAALELVRRRPVVGSGPDNFRLLYGRVAGSIDSDTRIRANNLYLELLSGSGVAGLAGFLFMMASWRRKATTVAALSIGFYLLHGIADDFLMTTPIYFGFWILLGQVRMAGDSLSERAAAP